MESKQKGYIISALRRVWRWSKERRECLKNAKGYCSTCKHKRKELQADHIIPVGRFDDTENPYITRLFCPLSNLQAVCKLCHRKKTAQERKARLAIKSEAN